MSLGTLPLTSDTIFKYTTTYYYCFLVLVHESVWRRWWVGSISVLASTMLLLLLSSSLVYMFLPFGIDRKSFSKDNWIQTKVKGTPPPAFVSNPELRRSIIIREWTPCKLDTLCPEQSGIPLVVRLIVSFGRSIFPGISYRYTPDKDEINNKRNPRAWSKKCFWISHDKPCNWILKQPTNSPELKNINSNDFFRLLRLRP